MLLAPPPDVPPGRLFRLMLRRPRPWIELDYRVPGAEQIPLHVRALRAVELADAFDVAGQDDGRDGRASCEVVARALMLQDGAHAFASGRQVAESLDAPTAERLAAEVIGALEIVSPVYSMLDDRAWHRRLIAGAREPHNWHGALTLGSCVSFAFGHGVSRVTHHPERYFGGAQGDLTDGQWLAFRAARAVVIETEKDR